MGILCNKEFQQTPIKEGFINYSEENEQTVKFAEYDSDWKEQLALVCEEYINTYSWAKIILGVSHNYQASSNQEFIQDIKLDLIQNSRCSSIATSLRSFAMDTKNINKMEFHQAYESLSELKSEKMQKLGKNLKQYETDNYLKQHLESFPGSSIQLNTLKSLETTSLNEINNALDNAHLNFAFQKNQTKNNKLLVTQRTLDFEKQQQQNGTRSSYSKITTYDICYILVLILINFCFFIEKELAKYNLITNKIENHIQKKPNHPLGQLITLYIDNYCTEYSEFLDQKDNLSLIASTYKQMVENIIDFVFGLIEIIIRFYKIKIFTTEDEKNKMIQENKQLLILKNLYTPSNLYNFLLCLIFQSKQIYNLVFEFQETFDSLSGKQLKQNLMKYEQLAKKTPIEFGIQAKFCLDEKTVDFMLEQLENKEIEYENIVSEKLLEDEDDMKSLSINQNDSTQLYQQRKSNTFITNSLNNIKEQEKKKNIKQQQFLNKLKQLQAPYESAITLLQTIQEMQSPLNKVILLQSVSKEVLNCIFNFYKQFDLQESFEIINSDLILIYMYILIKSKLPNIQSHFNFIETFINTADLMKIQNELFSYFSLRSNIDYLESLKLGEEEEKMKFYNESEEE